MCNRTSQFALRAPRNDDTSLLHLARIHLDRCIQHPGRKRGPDIERLFHAEIGLHQLVILLHPLGVDPAQRLGRRKLIGHQKLDALPLAFLVFLVQTEAWSSSAFRQGATSATQAAKAFWLTRTNSSTSLGFFSR